MNYKKRALTFLLDLILIFSVILISVFSRKKLELYITSLQDFAPQLDSLGTILSQQNLTTYNVTSTEQIISQTNHMIISANIWLYLIPISMILIYLITQSINWKLLNKTKIKTFILASIPFLIITLLFLNSLLTSISTILYNFSINIVWPIILLILFLIIAYLTLIFYTKERITLKFIRHSIKRLILPYILMLITSFFILINSLLIYIFLIINQSILVLIPTLILLLILFNIQRTSFIKRVKSI